MTQLLMFSKIMTFTELAKSGLVCHPCRRCCYCRWDILPDAVNVDACNTPNPAVSRNNDVYRFCQEWSRLRTGQCEELPSMSTLTPQILSFPEIMMLTDFAESGLVIDYGRSRCNLHYIIMSGMSIGYCTGLPASAHGLRS
jgi:hypothetical protein